jgi:hypothetical protein
MNCYCSNLVRGNWQATGSGSVAKADRGQNTGGKTAGATGPALPVGSLL